MLRRRSECKGRNNFKWLSFWQKCLLFDFSPFALSLPSGFNFHYHSEQRDVQDFVMMIERNVTSIMHFLLEDATHGHTWPGVTERDGQEEDENK